MSRQTWTTTAPAKKRFLTGAGPARATHEVAETFPKIPALVVDYKRCGKAGCRCTTGMPHGPYFYLRWREGPIQRRRYVRASDVPAVRAILDKRRTERNLQRLAFALSLHSCHGLDRLVAEVEARLRAEGEDS